VNINPKTLFINFPALQSWVFFLAGLWLLSLIGFGWLLKSVLILMAFLILAPAIAITGAYWWLKRKLVQDACPSCGIEFMAVNNSQAQCPHCGEALQIEDRQFQRFTPAGTIDVQAVEVSSQGVEE
jgi:predicted RNA-binding Zn-ribbon protein involved in translation (DUF1610 family)